MREGHGSLCDSDPYQTPSSSNSPESEGHFSWSQQDSSDDEDDSELSSFDDTMDGVLIGDSASSETQPSEWEVWSLQGRENCTMPFLVAL